MRTRQEIRSAAAPWSAPLLWYARGVGVLQKRPISDKTSWLFLAAMHGIDPDAWAQFGYLFERNVPSRGSAKSDVLEPVPASDLVLLAVASRLSLDLRGHRQRSDRLPRQPPADWGLPYWNYSDTKTSGANAIPKEFTDQTMPDGSPNPLFVEARFGQGVPARDAALNRSIIFGTFVGNDANSAPPGVGGPSTPFSNSGESGGLRGGLSP